MKHSIAYKFRILAILLLGVSFTTTAQNKKIESFEVAGDDILISVNTSHTNITFETWNKDKVEVEAYIEGENLTEAEKKQILESWNLEVLGNSSRIVVSSYPGLNLGGMEALSGLSELGRLEFLGPMMENMPVMTTFEMPVMPDDLLKNMGTMKFDYEAYNKDEEAYMKKWEAEIKEKFGKDFQVKMEKWGDEFAKEWDEKNGERLSAEWEAKMEAWGEKFGKEMEAWGENFGKDMEKWAKQFEDENPNGTFTKKVITDPNGNKTILLKSNKTGKLKDVKATKHLIIRMPKNSKTEINVRHGEIKMADAINVKATLNYSAFTANSIDGGATLINAAYAPVIVNEWKRGTLYVKFVENCTISTVDRINLRSNSSDVLIGTITGDATLVGSLGNFKIDAVSKGFNSINITLKNNDAIFAIPNNNFNFTLDGKRSTLKYPKVLNLTSSKKGERVLIQGYLNRPNPNKIFTIDALYSNVTLH